VAVAAAPVCACPATLGSLDANDRVLCSWAPCSRHCLLSSLATQHYPPFLHQLIETPVCNPLHRLWKILDAERALNRSRHGPYVKDLLSVQTWTRKCVELDFVE